LKARSNSFFACLLAISVFAWWNPLAATLALALRDDQYTHILLILPISATLIFVDWKFDGKPQPWAIESSSRATAIIAAVCLGLALIANVFPRSSSPLLYDLRLTVDMLALIVWWIASFALCFGPRLFRRALFPLGFLLWMVPLPASFMNTLIGWLQRSSAAAAYWLFAAAGFDVVRRGLLIDLPGLTLEVAPECSSIRSSLILLLTTMVLAHLLLRSPWRKGVVVAAAIPLAVAKNGLRIFALGALATRVDPSYLTGTLHRQGGILYFLIALAAILVLAWRMRRGEATTEPKENASQALV
jgi:exosortase